MSYTLARRQRYGVTLIITAPDAWDATDAAPAVEVLSHRRANWALSPIGLRRFAPLPAAELPAPLPAELAAAGVDFRAAESAAAAYLATYGAELVAAIIAREVTP